MGLHWVNKNVYCKNLITILLWAWKLECLWILVMFQQLLVTRQGYESGLPWPDSNYVSHSFRNTGLSTDSSSPFPPSTSSSESSSDSSSEM